MRLIKSLAITLLLIVSLSAVCSADGYVGTDYIRNALGITVGRYDNYRWGPNTYYEDRSFRSWTNSGPNDIEVSVSHSTEQKVGASGSVGSNASFTVEGLLSAELGWSLGVGVEVIDTWSEDFGTYIIHPGGYIRITPRVAYEAEEYQKKYYGYHWTTDTWVRDSSYDGSCRTEKDTGVDFNFTGSGYELKS